jgi:hypothetical protein
MLVMLGSKRRCCDGITRRESLRVGALSLLGGAFNLPSVPALAKSAGSHVRAGKARSVIVLYLYGGAPWQDMLDMKPDAPAEIRGEFKPAPSNVPGITVCELLPRLGRWMHRAAIVRSVQHRGGDHNSLPSYTGDERPVDSTFTLDTYPPSMGSVCEYLKKGSSQQPGYVYLPNYLGWGQAIRRPGPYAGFLGKRYDPLFTECSPYVDNRPAKPHIWDTYQIRGEPRLPESVLREGITVDRLNTRRTLVQQIDDQLRRLPPPPQLTAHERTRQQAFSILTSPQVKAAFDLDKEDTRLRDRYGRTLFGASTLIARKLVETGVRFVNVTWDLYWERLGLGGPSWDTHGRNFVILRESHLPYFDLAYSALMEDLDSRGLLDETLVVVMSEMGRTPKINADAGRDHWTGCYSVLFAGAGIRGGTIYGASDALAAYVKDKPVSPGDICATIYECLGIDPDMPVHDHSGRPVPIANGGRAIREILA